MQSKQESSVWNELWDSFKFYMESKNGKYSLDTYLDIVGEYTDRQIKMAEEEGLKYLGGECLIINAIDTDTYDFEIEMFFEDNAGNQKIKEAKRKLPKCRFVSETEQEVGDKIKFEIQRPIN